MALLALLVPMAAGQCPEINELDVLYDSDTFMCAYVWQGPGDDDPIQACTLCDELSDGEIMLREDGHSHSADEGQYTPIGSLITMPGCTFYGFGDYNYAGDVDEYPEGTHPNVGGYDQGDSCGTTLTGYQSYKCECIQKMIECSPSDAYDNVLTCDGLESDVEFSCSYTETIGTAYSIEATDSMGISDEVTSTVQTGLFDIFSSDLGESSTTSYDWSTTSSQTFEVSQTYEVGATVPPRTKVWFEGQVCFSTW